MAHYRVYDQETARLLAARAASADIVDLAREGEYLSANPGDVILAPSVNSSEVLYIRIKAAAVHKTRTEASRPEPTPAPASTPKVNKQYVATGFLGLDGDLEEDLPAPPKSWWKKLFVD